MSQTDHFETLITTLDHMHLLFVAVDGMVNHNGNSLDSYEEELSNLAMIGQDLTREAKTLADVLRHSLLASETTPELNS